CSRAGIGDPLRAGCFQRICRDVPRSISAPRCKRGAAVRPEHRDRLRPAAQRESRLRRSPIIEQRNAEEPDSQRRGRRETLMLNGVILWSLQNRLVVLGLALLLFGFGIYSAVKAPLDVFPDFAPPQV